MWKKLDPWHKVCYSSILLGVGLMLFLAVVYLLEGVFASAPVLGLAIAVIVGYSVIGVVESIIHISKDKEE